MSLNGDVIVQCRHGENSLSGLPRNYSVYLIRFIETAIPTVDNINSILQWKAAEFLILDDINCVFVLGLLERIDEMAQMTKLGSLQFTVLRHTYKKIDVVRFIENVPSLKMVEVVTNDKLNCTEREEFIAKNPAPKNWRITDEQYVIVYSLDDHLLNRIPFA